MKPQLAFVAYPVSDVSVSHRFYNTVLAVEARVITDNWLEYDTDEAAFVITQADTDQPGNLLEL